MKYLTLKNTRQGSLSGNDGGGFIAAIERPSSGSFIMGCKLLYETRKNARSQRYGMYQCQCGKLFETLLHSVKSGDTTSCGCARKTHGFARTKIYYVWINIRARCFRENNPSYYRYGGRGITMYSEWIEDFRSFHDYIKTLPGYGKGLTIDRINNDGNYEPGNLRWADRHTQAANRGGVGVSFAKREKIIIHYKDKLDG